jgi:GTP-binding protein
MLPVIAIVGRPNVGKSTLFNCLTRTRDAVISAFPGTTRDRQYGEVNLAGRRFIIIDTGGITEERDQVGELTRQQSLQAVQDADFVLFMIDAKAGITPEDRNLAAQLRRFDKPLFLAVNKTENMNPSLFLSDAFELGIKKPIPISASHKQGLHSLVETLFPEVSDNQTEINQTESGIKLAIVGRPNVGKSTLTNRILGEERVIVHDSPGTTRDSIYIPFVRLDQAYTLIDTAGVRRRKNITELPEKFSIVKTLQAIESSHIVLYVIDATAKVTEQDLRLLGFILECGKGLVIAVNKWDGLTQDIREQAKSSLARQLDFINFARIHYISALHGSGVGNLFDSVKEAYASATKQLSTPLLTRLLQKALLAHSPPLIKGRRVKLRYAHPGGHNPPVIVIHGNQVNALPESYRKFLAHYFQDKLELFGTPVQIQFKGNDNPFQNKK